MPSEKTLDESGVQVNVTWSNDHVQVATLWTDPGPFVAWCRHIVERVDKALAEMEDDGKPKPSVPANAREVMNAEMGAYWTPVRGQINKLIRDLRRARDQAYGRDE